ncbi:BTAD domain-containing putative transcriptional regulator [Acrocarpospora phusangensis]|uniref:BTAD domain-containing putative transcriptional regulator n=1 Tax=Acrocarpospora phusangensis TaxID=1070424 RepID=UPI0019528303|nr:BTAD domain-containing putative transcriptional regulator [Acrocarpospora phusangensis]
MTPVRVRLLGPVDVTVDGAPQPVPGLRRKAVLAILALRQGEVVNADRLIEIVWDGRPPATAMNTLQSHVSYLRRALGRPGAIVARPPGYMLDLGEDATDVRLAERLIEQARAAADPAARVDLLDRALELWRGPPLADVGDLPWFGDEAERLERVRRLAEQARVEARLALGGHLRLVPELEGLTERHPFDEDLNGLLMLALYRSGRQADALAAFQRLRTRLREELGIDPGVPLRELESAILRQDPALDHAPAVAAEHAPGPSLVERSAEAELIDRALDRAARRKAGSVLIFEGPGGIGKTSMLEYARGRADLLGFTTTSARGSELEFEYAWGCVRQLFERFAGSAAPAASAFLRWPDAEDAPRGEYPIINTLFWLASDLASRSPLLIVLDDLHWADPSSVRFLAYLAARLDDLPVVAMVALRPGTEQVEQVVSVLAGLPHSVTRTLPPLTPAGSAELLSEVLDGGAEEELVARCHEAARGNPFLLRELGRELAAREQGDPRPESSPSIARFVARQLRHLPPAATGVAHALGVLGDDVGSGELAQVTRTSQQEVLDLLSALVAGELVTARGTPPRFSFGHPLIRAAVYDGIPPGTRAELHLRAAGVAGRDQDPVKAATQLLRVPPGMGGQDTVAILNRATDLSLASGSATGAAAFLRRTLQEDLGERRVQVLTRLGMTEALVDMAQAIEHLSHALALEPDPEERARIAYILASTQWLVGRPREAALVCQAALERERGISVGTRQALQACIGMVATGTRHGGDLVALHGSFSGQRPDSSLGGLLFEASLALREMFRNERASAERRALRVISDDHVTGEALAEPMLTCAWYVLVACDNPRLLPTVEAMLDHSRRTGSLRSAAPGYTYRAAYMLSRGHLEEAVRDGWLAWEVSKNGGVDVGLSFISDWLIPALVARGEIGAAQSVLDQVRTAHGAGVSRAIYASGEIALLMAQGHTQRAYETALATRDECRTLGMVNPVVPDWLAQLVRCLLLLGRPEEARAAAQDLYAAAQTWGTPRATGRALRIMAATESGPRALDLLTESVRLLEDTDIRLEHAISRYALGEALRHEGRLPDAQAELRTAIDLARFCGARPLQHRATTSLAMAGGHAGPPADLTLTPTEQRIADLSADGRSDREIAEVLYLSVSAVRDHREAVTRKRG